MADEWSAFKQRPAAPADTADPWASLKVQRTQPFPEKPEGYPYLTPDTAQAAMPAITGAVEPILNAFGQGFREGWGPQRIGIPDQDVHWLSKVGIFAPENQSSYTNPFHAFNELLAETIWRTPE